MVDKAEDWQQIVIAFKQCFACDAGQKVLDVLSYQCFERTNTFVDGNEDQGQRNLGKREIILMIRDWLNKDPNNIPDNLRKPENA